MISCINHSINNTSRLPIYLCFIQSWIFIFLNGIFSSEFFILTSTGILCFQIISRYEGRNCEVLKYKRAIKAIEGSIKGYSSGSSSSSSSSSLNKIKENQSKILGILTMKSLLSVIEDKGKKLTIFNKFVDNYMKNIKNIGIKEGVSSSSASSMKKSNKSFKSSDNIPSLNPNKFENILDHFKINKSLKLKKMIPKWRFFVIKEESYSQMNEREEIKSNNSFLMKEETPWVNRNENRKDSQELEVFLGSVVHEFRQPINVISTSFGIINAHVKAINAILGSIPEMNFQTKKEGNFPLKIFIVSSKWKSSLKILKIWNISTLMMDKLTDDIMDLSKIKAGVYSLNERNFTISTLVEQISYFFETQWELKGILFQVNCEESSMKQTFCSDQGRITQILLNFISNSMKFTSHGSIVVNIEVVSVITSEFPSRILNFSIEDTGEGISNEEKKELFQMFGKVKNEKNDTHNMKGTGLGLFISKKLIGIFRRIFLPFRFHWNPNFKFLHYIFCRFDGRRGRNRVRRRQRDNN